jgi:hypothetical protein
MHVLKSPHYRFLTRWLVCTLGLWIAAGLIGKSISYGQDASVVIIAGLVLAIINTVLKPFIIILSLPALIFSLGIYSQQDLYFSPCNEFLGGNICRYGDWPGKLFSEYNTRGFQEIIL